MQSSDVYPNKPASLSMKSVRNQIYGWGGLTALIYLVYVIIFPLVPLIYREGTMLDIELILRNGMRWLIWVYVVGLGLLFYAFWRMVRVIHEFSKQDPLEVTRLRKAVLGIGTASGLILIGLYPITALDVAGYVVNARHWVLYGANPLTVAPDAFPDDPYTRLTGEFADETSPYGPLWEGLARVPVQMGITDIAGAIVAMKFISLLAFVGTALLIGWGIGQQSSRFQVQQTTALAFFALNPLVLLESMGNGHNDITMLFLIVLGLYLWSRGKWPWAAFALTLAALIKLPGLVMLPLFGVSVLMQADTWRKRILYTLGIGAIFLGTFLLAYLLMGPIPEVWQGALHSFTRRSFSPPYALYVIAREVVPEYSRHILAQSRNVFLVFYGFLVVAMLRKKMTLLEAGFLAYLAINFLSNAFRIWYPLWIVPFAALNLNSRTYWRTFLFSLTAEFSILSYYVLWRWVLRNWEWGGVSGPLAPYWDYFKIMTPFNVAWAFSIPFVGDIVGWFRDRERFRDSLWI